MRNEIGVVRCVPNDHRRFGENDTYYHVRVRIRDHGPEEDWLLTGNEWWAVNARARRNPEDLPTPKPTIVGQLMAFALGVVATLAWVHWLVSQ